MEQDPVVDKIEVQQPPVEPITTAQSVDDLQAKLAEKKKILLMEKYTSN
jgi:hypothetical protein